MNWFINWLKARGSWRHITRTGRPYLERFFLAKGRHGRVYLHRFWDSDDSFAVHDHPSWNFSFVLKGKYYEHYYDGTVKERKAGSITFRQAEVAHWIEIPEDQKGEVWSFFVMGKTTRKWGFYMPDGWVEASEVADIQGRDFELNGWLFPKFVWLKEQQ